METLQTYLLNANGDFGPYGGCYVPEVLRANMDALAAAFDSVRSDPDFWAEFVSTCTELSGRPTPLTPLRRLSAELGGAQLYLKNEGLNHTGAHKITHVIGQVLLAQRLGRQHIIAETGAGQHGYATATVCARFGLPCTVYMGRKDYHRQRPNVYWMELLGAEVVPVDVGEQTLNDAVIAAFQALIQNPAAHYLLGSAVGPHPYPILNTFFQQLIGQETQRQCLELTGRLPDVVVGCVGGGSSALGMFFPFLDEPTVRLIGVEAGGHGDQAGQHASKVRHGKPGIFEGYSSLFLQDDDGNMLGTSSVSAGLDYGGVSPLLAYLFQQGRVEFASATDANVLEALQHLARTEGIILALESAHGLAHALALAPQLSREQTLVINGSGRGEKDLFITMQALQPAALRSFLEEQLSVK